MKYTYDEFLCAAKECGEIKSLFICKHRRLYDFSREIGWFANYPWKAKTREGNIYLIYCYKDEDTLAIYIGLTCNLKKRHSGHKCNGAVYNYFSQKGKNVPEPIVLVNDLTANEAKEKEGDYCELYSKDGWVLINKAKTGDRSSSLGGNKSDKWTYETCYEESKKYKTKTEFQIGNVSAYRKALDNGWLDSWFRSVDKTKWTREKCYEEATKYKSRSEFRLENQSAYNSALRNEWLNDYYWFIKRQKLNKWDEHKCLEVAKQCSSKTDFAKRFSGAYKEATKNGRVKNYTWFERTSTLLSKRSVKWTYERCKEVAMKYKRRWEFGRENSGAYHVCLKNKWLDSFTWLIENRK